MRWLMVAAFVFRGTLTAGIGADFGKAIREISFDRDECYRVRDVTVFKEDLKIYLTDGHLIFSKPVAGRRIAAVFVADVEGGDGEVILLPPNRAERTSLAVYTDSPNLDEHFRSALLFFTGADYEALLSQLPRNPANKKSPDAAAGLDDLWTPTLRSVADSFQTRIALDLLGGPAGRPGLFAGLFQGVRLGSFDVIFDPHGEEQLVAGSVVVRDDRIYFNTWTSFQARSLRHNPPPRRNDVLLSDYRIQSTLNPDLTLDCVTRVKVKSVVDGATAVSFEMTPQMAVSSATVDGQPAETLQRDSVRANIGRTGNELFLVFPPEPLRAGRVYEFEFKHSGKVILDAGDHVFYVTARGNWYPTHNLQFAQYDLQFRYPADLDLVAAGDVVENRTEGEWRITRRRTAATIRFAAFNLGRYEHVRVESAGYLVDVCANRSLESALQPKPQPSIPLPAPIRSRQAADIALPVTTSFAHNPLERLQGLAAEVASSLQFMVSHFGPPALPHIAVSPIPGAFGQGFPGLIYISTLAYLKDLPGQRQTAESQQLYFDELLQAHEVAHQWWGNRVTSTSYRDGWLMEALANTSAMLYLERRKGAHSAEVMLDSYRSLLLEKSPTGPILDAAGPVTFGSRLNSSQAPTAYRTITYGKGTWVMQMLRRRMGDERFLAMLTEVIKQYDHRDITTDQFRQLAAEFLPPQFQDPQLETFFDQWVYSTGIPNLKLSYSLKGTAPALRLVGTVKQSDVDEDFSTLVPVEIQVARGQTITQWVRTGGESATFTVQLKQAPLKVTLDPHYAVLRRH
jgi:Peptidase family M1 domain